MSGNHVRQPCPATMSAKILRAHTAPPSNVQFVRSSMRFVMPSPACFVIHAVVHPAVCSAAHTAFAPSPILPSGIYRPFHRPRHSRPFMQARLATLPALPENSPCLALFHHCLTPLLSFIRPHDQPYRPYMEHLASSPAAPSAANIYTHLNDAHILHAKDKIESVFAPEMELAHENKVAQKLHKPETIPYEQKEKASKSQ